MRNLEHVSCYSTAVITMLAIVAPVIGLHVHVRVRSAAASVSARKYVISENKSNVRKLFPFVSSTYYVK